MSPSESAAVSGQREDTTNTIYLQIIRWQVSRWNDSIDLSAASLEVSMWSTRGHRTFDSATGWGFLTQNLLIATVTVLWPRALNIFHDKILHIWNCRCVTTARKKPVENDLRKYSHRIPQRVHTLPHRIHVLMYGISTKSTIHGSYVTWHLSGLLRPKFGWCLERSRVICLETCPSPIFVVGRGYSRGRLALMGPSFFFVYSPPSQCGNHFSVLWANS